MFVCAISLSIGGLIIFGREGQIFGEGGSTIAGGGETRSGDGLAGEALS